MRMLFVLLLTLSLLLAGCGIGRGGNDDQPDPASIEDAETCEDVADYFVVVGQDFIDDAEDAGMTALAAGAESEVLQRYLPKLEEIGQKADELGCSEDEMRPLLLERIDDLETDGPVGNLIVNVLYDQVVGP